MDQSLWCTINFVYILIFYESHMNKMYLHSNNDLKAVKNQLRKARATSGEEVPKDFENENRLKYPNYVVTIVPL